MIEHHLITHLQVELEYFNHGGILPYAIRNLINQWGNLLWNWWLRHISSHQRRVEYSAQKFFFPFFLINRMRVLIKSGKRNMVNFYQWGGWRVLRSYGCSPYLHSFAGIWKIISQLTALFKVVIYHESYVVIYKMLLKMIWCIWPMALIIRG